MRHSHVVVAHVWQHNRPATTFKDVVSIILVVRMLLAFKREHSAAILPRPSAAGAGLSGCCSNLGDCVEIAKFSMWTRSRLRVTNLPRVPADFLIDVIEAKAVT
jgi:hypothetical protein